MEEKAKKLLAAIKKDDLAAFKKVFDKDTEKYCFGRFPLLSLCYLYGSVKIAFTYERRLLRLSRYTVIEEDRESYYLFRKHARRVLRLFVGVGRPVSPLVMLSVLGRHDALKALYPAAYKDETIREEIAYAAETLYGSSVTFGRNSIRIRRQHTTRLQKITTYAACAVAAVMIACALVGYFLMPNDKGTADSPVSLDNGRQLVLALKNDGHYTLTNNVEMTIAPGSEFKGSLDGGGHKVSLSGGASGAVLNKIEGTIKNVEFVIDVGDKEVSESTALFIAENAGVLENVTVTVKGKLSVKGKESTDEEKETIYLSAFVGKNGGTVSGCAVKCDLTADNPSGTNAYLAGLVSENSGTVTQCTTNGTISTSTTDVAGLVSENEKTGVISGCKSSMNLSQESSKEGWSPNVGGLCLHNYGTITESEFSGAINVRCSVEQAEGTNGKGETVYAGGIGCFNEGDILSCVSSGTMECVAKDALQCVGGIAGYNYTAVENNQFNLEKIGSVVDCSTSMKIDLTSSGAYAVYAGGLVGLNDTGVVGKSTTETEIKCDSACHYLGGAVGANTSKSSYYSSLYNQVYDQYQKQLSISSVESAASIEATGSGETDRCVGGIVGLSTINLTDCKYEGALKVSDGSLIGGIAGVCQSQIENCSATLAAIAGDNCYVGGIAGLNGYQISSSSAKVDIKTGKNATVGGIAGKVYSNSMFVSLSVDLCEAEGSLVGGESCRLGGIVGQNEGGKVRYGFSAVSFGAGEGSSVGGVVGSADVSSVYYTYNYSQQYYYKNAYVGDGIKGIGEIAGYTEVPEDAYDTQSTRYATEEEMKQGDEYKEMEAYKNETD